MTLTFKNLNNGVNFIHTWNPFSEGKAVPFAAEGLRIVGAFLRVLGWSGLLPGAAIDAR